MLIAAPADSRLEASCRYARSAEYRDEQAEEEELLLKTEMAMSNTWWWRAQAKKVPESILYGRPQGAREEVPHTTPHIVVQAP